MYQVRRVHIGKTAQLDELAHACGELYSRTLVFFWRTVRHKGIWLKPRHLMRLFTNPNLHAHTSDACVQAFFAGLSSWRERRKTDASAHPPRRRKWYFRIEYKRSAMKREAGLLQLSNGRSNAPLVLEWPWDLPQTVVIHWTGTEYEAIATYRTEETAAKPLSGEVAGIDLGEAHMAVSHDGTQTHILNGRGLRAKRQYRNKLIEHLGKSIDRKQKGSVRRKKLIKSKQKQLRKLRHKSRISNTSRPHGSFPRCIERACKPWSLAMFGIFGKTTMWAPPTTRKSISGPMAVSGTCLPTRQSDWE